MSRPSLVVVGTGIQVSAHMTPLAFAHVAQAGKVLYLTTDFAAASSSDRTARWAAMSSARLGTAKRLLGTPTKVLPTIQLLTPDHRHVADVGLQTR